MEESSMSNSDPSLPNLADMDEGSDSEQPLLKRADPDADAPQDRFYAVYWIMFLFGVGSLLPWNMFITANQYFEAEFPAYPSVQKNFETYLIVASQVPNVIVLFANAFYKNTLPEKTRIIASLLVMFFMMLMTTILAALDTQKWQGAFLGITYTSVVFMNVASAVFQGGVFGIVGRFPQKYRQAVMSGQGLGGSFAALANIFSYLGAGGAQTLSTAQLEKSAVGYFSSAVLVIIISLIGYILLLKLPFAMHYAGDSQSARGESSVKPAGHFKKVIRQIWPMLLSVSMVFFVTLAIFPAMSAGIKSVNEREDTCNTSITNQTLGQLELAWTCTYFTPVTCFLLFNVMDFIGRTIPTVVKKPGPRYLLIPVALRLLFIPLYLFCKYDVTRQPYFNSDAAPIILMVFMGLSNGYLGTLSFIYAPSSVEAEDGETAGALTAAFLGAGLLSGTFFSFLSGRVLVPAVQAHLPKV